MQYSFSLQEVGRSAFWAGCMFLPFVQALLVEHTCINGQLDIWLQQAHKHTAAECLAPSKLWSLSLPKLQPPHQRSNCSVAIRGFLEAMRRPVLAEEAEAGLVPCSHCRQWWVKQQAWSASCILGLWKLNRC